MGNKFRVIDLRCFEGSLKAHESNGRGPINRERLVELMFYGDVRDPSSICLPGETVKEAVEVGIGEGEKFLLQRGYKKIGTSYHPPDYDPSNIESNLEPFRQKRIDLEARRQERITSGLEVALDVAKPFYFTRRVLREKDEGIVNALYTDAGVLMVEAILIGSAAYHLF